MINTPLSLEQLGRDITAGRTQPGPFYAAGAAFPDLTVENQKLTRLDDMLEVHTASPVAGRRSVICGL